MSDLYMDDFEEIEEIHVLYTDGGEIEARYRFLGDDVWDWVSLDEYSGRRKRLTQSAIVEYIEDALGVPVANDCNVTLTWVDDIDE